MLSRTLPLVLGLALAASLAPGAQAQYRTLDDGYDRAYDDGRYEAPGVRLGFGLGAFSYYGPDLFYTAAEEQDDAHQTRLGVTAHLAFPLASDRLYGRLTAGLLNIGADEDAAPPGQNPFLTNEIFLGEADLLLNLLSYRQSTVVPYLFSGFGALVADPFGQDDAIGALDRERVAYFIPLGAGVDFRLSRNLSVYLEGSYRWVLNEVGEAARAGTANAGGPKTPCDIDPDSFECKCYKYPDKPECDEVGPVSDVNYDDIFRSSLLSAGVQIGFGAPPPPPPPPPPPVLPEVCDLVELNTVYFEYGSAELSPRARALLDENVQLLRENPQCCIYVDGYTDTSEYDQFGMPLAGRRAQAVYDHYLDRGIAADRMHVRNRGASYPPCDKEDEEEGCRRGRRVESIPLDCERFLDSLGGGY
jgi:outer membrane protein OmpA-like peptidoglycan-associated protein